MIRHGHAGTTQADLKSQMIQQLMHVIIIGITGAAKVMLRYSPEVKFQIRDGFQAQYMMVVKFGDIFKGYPGQMGMNDFFQISKIGFLR